MTTVSVLIKGMAMAPEKGKQHKIRSGPRAITRVCKQVLMSPVTFVQLTVSGKTTSSSHEMVKRLISFLEHPLLDLFNISNNNANLVMKKKEL